MTLSADSSRVELSRLPNDRRIKISGFESLPLFTRYVRDAVFFQWRAQIISVASTVWSPELERKE